MSNILDPDQDRHSVGPDLFQTDCKGYQQTTKVTVYEKMVLITLGLGIKKFLILLHVNNTGAEQQTDQCLCYSLSEKKNN